MGMFSEISQFCSVLFLDNKSLQGKLHIVTLAIVMAVCATGLNSTRADVKLSDKEESSLKSVLNGTNKFAIDLYSALSKKASGNVFVSPLSAQIVLAQAYIGAKDSTADGLAQLLSLPKDLDQTLVGYNSLIRLLQDPVLNLANRIFVESSANIKEDFQKKVEKYFLSLAEPVDFKNNAEKVRLKINNWVEEQTKKKITNLLAPNSLSADTRLVLTNAIHFKANWNNRFNERATKEQPFFISKTKTVPVQMMNIKDKFAYSENKALGAKILGMDYEGGQFRMVIILPNEVDGLESVEAKMAKLDLVETTIKGLKGTTEVQVALPKFTLEETMNLNDALMSLGAAAMFNPKEANFKGITDESLFVSLVVQKSFVEVNEKGTEAAAATVAHIRKRRAVTLEEEFIADHPFIFSITHNESEGVLFIGRFCKPNIMQSQTDHKHDEF